MTPRSGPATETPVAPSLGTAPVLEACALTRRFGSFTALEGVDFAVRRGEVHALLGENGAGKSTLMNLLSGLLRPSDGEIRMDGQPVRFASPADATARGIGMVHQHFLLVPPLSVAENLLLGATGGPLTYPLRAVQEEARALAERLGWYIPWETPAGSLPVGTQQRVEILKALRGGAKRALIFDEPTAVLTPTETPELFAVIRHLAQEGHGVVFISHKLEEVMQLADRVTVLRRGRVVHRTRVRETSTDALAEAMVGKGSDAAAMLANASPPRRQTPQERAPTPRLEVENLTTRAEGHRSLDGIHFRVASGEILGIAGVDGNGQTELADCLSGLCRPAAGQIRVEGNPLRPDPNAFRHAGVALIPADRQRRGLALPMTLTENFALGVHDDPEFRRGPLLRWRKLHLRAARLIGRFDIRAEGPEAAAASLSGGNQQKVVIARALADQPKVLVAVNPTRGLDVGAIAYVHNALRSAQAAGAAILLLSTELDEVIALSDRIGVLYAGRLTGIVGPETPRERLGALMGGAAEEASESDRASAKR